jgi:hypothetical protein
MLMAVRQVFIRTVLTDTRPEVMEGDDLPRWNHCPVAFAITFFIEVVTQMDHIVNGILSGGITIHVKVPTVVFRTGEDAKRKLDFVVFRRDGLCAP